MTRHPSNRKGKKDVKSENKESLISTQNYRFINQKHRFLKKWINKNVKQHFGNAQVQYLSTK